jgi:hypothetical protein
VFHLLIGAEAFLKLPAEHRAIPRVSDDREFVATVTEEGIDRKSVV